MRVLFLDIDGVLNSQRWLDRLKAALPDGKVVLSSQAELDPSAIERLNAVIRATGAWIVVSSSWRLNYGRGVFDVLREAGVVAQFFDITPMTSERRGRQIARWLESHNSLVSAFAIVDDDTSAGDPHAREHVLTTWEDGLQDAHVAKLCELLGGACPWCICGVIQGSGLLCRACGGSGEPPRARKDRL